MELMEAKKLNAKPSIACPKNIIDRSSIFVMDESMPITEIVNKFTSKDCKLTVEARSAIFKCAVHQAANGEWHN